MPKVSVIIAAYNSENRIMKTVESVLKQTFSDFEIIIVNDASRDNTADVLNSIKDKRVKVINRKENHGEAYTLNECLDNSTGEYIANLNDDDLFYPEKLERQVFFMDNNPGVVLCGTLSDTIVDGHLMQCNTKQHFLSTMQRRFSLPFCINHIVHSSYMMRGSTIRDNQIRHLQDRNYAFDISLQVEMSKYGEIYVLPEKLVAIAQRQDQLTNTIDRKAKNEQATLVMRDAIRNISADDGIKQALFKGAVGLLKDKNDYVAFFDAFEEWGLLCGLGKEKTDSDFERSVFMEVLSRQYMKPDNVLMLNGAKGLFKLNKVGIRFLAKSLLRYNKYWKETEIVL